MLLASKVSLSLNSGCNIEKRKLPLNTSGPQGFSRHLPIQPESSRSSRYPLGYFMKLQDAPISNQRERGEKLVVHASSASSSSGESEPASLSKVYLCVAVACAGAFAFGYHLGVVNGPLEQIASDLGFLGNKAQEGLVVSSTLAGAALGSLTGGSLADALGRRRAFFLAAVPMLLGPLLCAWATGFTQLAIGRLITGVAIGLSSAVVPTYVSEVAPTRLRGALGTVNQLMICVGILAVLIVNVCLPLDQWRSFFMLGAVPAALLGLGMLLCPESPRWLSSSGNAAEADKAGRALWGGKVSEELSGGGAPLAEGGGKEESANMFAPEFRRGVLLGVFLFAIQQFAGINAIIYFSTSIFRQAGVASDALASAAVGATNVLGTIVAASIIEKAGRKQLLVNSYMGQAAAMIVMAAGFASPSLAAYAAPIAVGGTLLYILAFALGAGPVTGLIIPELNDGRIRGRAVAAAMTSHWVCNVAVGQTFMAAVAKVGIASVYTGFGAMALAGAWIISSQVPETKGKSFEQIASDLKSK